MAGYLDTGIMWDSQTSGAHVEGISVVTSNFQSNRYGLRGATATTGLSELAVTNSQFGDNQTAAIQISANVGDLLASNNLFELARIIHDSTSFSSPRRARAPSTSPDLIRIGV